MSVNGIISLAELFNKSLMVKLWGTGKVRSYLSADILVKSIYPGLTSLAMEPDAESPGEAKGRLQEAHGGWLPEPGAIHVQALRGPDLRLPRLHHQQCLLRGQGHPN